MSSLRKIEANRRNAQKSTGPRTPEGKAHSSLNAVSHGITARTLHLRTESGDELIQHMKGYLDEFHPATQAEHDLVAVLISSTWRLRRAWRTETALLDTQMVRDSDKLDKEFQSVDNDTRTALAFKALSDESRSWANLDRYQSHLRRDFRTALADLHRLRSDTPPAAVEPEPHTPSGPAPLTLVTSPVTRPEPKPNLQIEPNKCSVINETDGVSVR